MLIKLVVSIASLVSVCAMAMNIGGDGTSEEQAMQYYLIGDMETFPNLKLTLWNEKQVLDKTFYGQMRLMGELALRTREWNDLDE